MDVFFVLSGFLITTLLVTEYQRTGRVDRIAFYARRALRLLPALALAIVVTLIAWFLVPPGGGRLAWALGGVAFYMANWVAVANRAALGYFGQTWSLAIEEQFYLVWPLVLAAAVARRRLPPVLASAITGAVVLRALVYVVVGSGVGLWTPFRVDQLLVGASAGLATAAAGRWRRLASNVWAATASVCVLAGLAFEAIPEAILAFGGYTIIGVLAAIAVSHVAVAEDSPITRLLSVRPLVAIGRISYGLYLFHYPVFLALLNSARVGQWEMRAIGFPVAFGLATASWFVIEKPALRMKRRFERVAVDFVPSDAPAP